jgi:hypothetical protein
MKNLVIAPLLLSLALACTITTQGQPGGSGAGTPDGSVTVTGANTSCAEAVTCIANCPDNDEPCSNACYDRASPTGQTLLNTLVTCISDSMCADGACVKQKCPSQLSACIDDVAPPATSTVPPTTAAPLPAALVGTWSSVDSTSGESYTFKADGTYESLIIYEPSGRCVITAKLVAFVDGVASTNGQTLSLTPIKGRVDTTDCSDTTTSKPSNPPNRAVTWSVAADLLTLTEGGNSANYRRN